MKLLSLDRFSKTEGGERAFKYSFLKLGQAKAVHSYGEELAARILQEIPALNTAQDDWVIVYPGTGANSIPNAITYVARHAGEKLGVACVGLGKRDNASSDYAGRSKAERMKSRCIELLPGDAERVTGKNFILVDDGIATGTAIEKSAMLLQEYGTVAVCIVLADLRAVQDPSFERHLNRQILMSGGVEVYPALLNNSQNYITSKMICYLSEDKSLLTEACEDFTPLSLVNMAVGMMVYHKKSAAPHLTEVRRDLIERHSKRDDKELRKLNQLIELNSSDSPKTTELFTTLSEQPQFRLDTVQFDQMCDALFASTSHIPKVRH